MIRRFLTRLLIFCGYKEPPDAEERFIWHRQPVTAPLPAVRHEPPPVLGIRQRRAALSRVQLVSPDPLWRADLDTRRVTEEETAKYKALPKWAK